MKIYLSFADPDPDKFLGACVVEAGDLTSAVIKSHKLGINPGGEVMAWDYSSHYTPLFPLDVLLSKEDLAMLFGEVNLIRMGDDCKEAEAVSGAAMVVGDDENDSLSYLG